MRRRRSPLLLALGFLLMAGMAAADHLAAAVKLAGHPRSIRLAVRSEPSRTGHLNLGIDEKKIEETLGERFLQFATLAQWRYDPKKPTPAPAAIQQLSGSRFSAIGFMYPLEVAAKIQVFCLLRSTQTCCYGPKPQFDQYLLVESATPIPPERFEPILVRGTFFVDPKPDEGYIYRMEADSVTRVEPEDHHPSARRLAERAGMPLFDYGMLRRMEPLGVDAAPPAELAALDGRRVVLEGHVVDRDDADPPVLTLGEQWWDGVSAGTPPGMFNSVLVYPAGRDEVPPLWRTQQVYSGRLVVNRDPATRRDSGLVQLREARLGAPSGGAGKWPLWRILGFGLGVALMGLGIRPSRVGEKRVDHGLE